ncbi:hypothetical protein FACS1894211_16740 [Clostridia bacterium]|nr:hypothetical protein FACS1894211_16740 [Clostridia bacterium]
MAAKIYIQVGVTALRTPTGKHYPAVPLYIEADKLNASGLAPTEEKLLCGFTGFVIEEYAKRLAEQAENAKKTEQGVTENESIISGGVQ